MAGSKRTKNWIFDDKGKCRRAKLLFVPIVVGVTIFFWVFEGIHGAMVGFGYGLIGGLFVIHESLAVRRNTDICLHGIQKGTDPQERNKKGLIRYLWR
jgi:hypothetical protein